MGNDNSIPLSQSLVVGNNVTQILTRKDHYLEEDKLEKFELAYYIGNGLGVVLLFETTTDKDGLTRLVRFKIDQPGLIKFFLERTENNLLKLINADEFEKHGDKNFVNETKDPSGDIKKTYVVYQGREYREGFLFVVEQKTKSGVDNPYVVTLAHYYANYSEAFFGLKRYDAGLSVIVNIRVVDNNMDFVWIISHNNSSRALLPMFVQVYNTGTWKWNTCPYRAAEARRKQLIYMNRYLFRTNTETETETEDEEGSYVQLTKQIGSNVLANQGAIRGKNNGNMVVRNLYLKGRK